MKRLHTDWNNPHHFSTFKVGEVVEVLDFEEGQVPPRDVRITHIELSKFVDETVIIHWEPV